MLRRVKGALEIASPRGLRIALRPILARFVRSAQSQGASDRRPERSWAGPASNTRLPHAACCRTHGSNLREGKLENANATARVAFAFSGVPTGIRTPVIAVKGRCPRPLDDGD